MLGLVRLERDFEQVTRAIAVMVRVRKCTAADSVERSCMHSRSWLVDSGLVNLTMGESAWVSV